MKKTHIETQRTEAIDNKRYVLTVLEMYDLDYEYHFIECACNFLRELFPKSESNDEWYVMHRSHKFFWKWFRVQWMNAETTLILFHTEHHVRMEEEKWKQDMMELTSELKIQMDFHQYIKMITKTDLSAVESKSYLLSA
jgi:hypothetical protein